MTNEQAYIEGFCKAAEVAGVDPVALVKQAAPVGLGLVGKGLGAAKRYLSLLGGGNVSALEGRLAQANRVIERAGNNMSAAKMLGARQMHGANRGIMAGAKRIAAKSQAALDAERAAVSKARLLTGVGAGGAVVGGAAGALAAGGGSDEQNIHAAEALSLVIKRAEAVKRANAVKRAANVLDTLIGDRNGNPGVLSRVLANEHLRRAAVGALATGTTAALASGEHKLRNALLAAGAGGLATYGASATGALDNALTPFKPVNDVTRASGRAVASREIARKLRKPNPSSPYERMRASGSEYFSDPGVQKAYANLAAQIR